MAAKSPDAGRIFVLGLDGVPWDLVNGWMEDGELPSFQRLVRDGASGPLRSTMPPSTPLAWPSIATGTWPDQHGVYAFQKLESDYTHHIYTSRDVRQPTLWNLITPAVVANVPMTYPAQEVDGVMVTGFLTNGFGDGFTHPPGLAEELLSAVPGYRIGLDWDEYRSRLGEFQEELDALLASRRRLLKYLQDRDDWRLFFFVFVSPDRLQHLVWEEEALLAHYRLLDDILDDILTYVADQDANLLVVSDHGFGPVDGRVNVNTVLRREGYLEKKSPTGVRSVLDRLGVRKDRVLGALSKVGIDDKTLVSRVPTSLVEFAATTTPGNHGLYDVDFGETQAFAHGIGGIYVNDTERFAEGTVPPHEVARVVDEVRELFEAVTDPVAGRPVFTVYDGDDLYPRDPRAPDLVLEGDRYVPYTSLEEEVFSGTDGLVADHRPEGIFFALGPDIEAGSTVDATVVDIAPTVLHLADVPIPAACDGRVLTEVYAPDAAVATRPVRTREYEQIESDPIDMGDFDDVEDRLKGLGYME